MERVGDLLDKVNGVDSSCAVTRVEASASRWNVITPACSGPSSEHPGDPPVRVLLGDRGVESE
jgi:hypothetical protein